MSEYDFDLFTIGAGSGGVAASRRAASHGARVAICEADRVGGTCVLRGCVPKKLLVYAAHLRDELTDAAGYGWSLDGEPTLDWARLVAAKNAELDRLNGIYLRMLANAGVEVIEGRGVIIDPHTVEVRGHRYTTERILVATGGWPHVPEIPGAELGITSNEALELTQVPARMLIVGGGYIAVEFAGIFAGAGSKVTMLVRGYGVLREFDDDVHSALAEELQRRGIELETHTDVESVERRGDGVVAHCRGGHEHEADVLLWATGRWPNSRGVGLEEVGVALDDRGAVLVDEWSRTNVHGIFAIGDVTTRVALTPVAIADGRALAETLFNDNPTQIDHEGVPTAVFSQPQVGTVGLTEKQARARFARVDVYRTHFRPMKHILPGRQERTMMKLVVDKDSDRVLGVHMVGPDAAEIIQGFAVALKCGATKKQFDATVAIHPSSAEEFVTMAKPLE
ncbi:glutathione-disulfide reductase [Paraliomyxa miuraensis]|uniref:glutathione-disulfide reductase n=1 Tax=Paraliomyxa miuraensis TaxID=376150 RepID=UPI0022556287|nr:glutathione-disulfide reductase [Paraliomyxa miuraensis]MCX4243515.1 glutathione-disulfide reductase [Paraliomyxa miuraensis]